MNKTPDELKAEWDSLKGTPFFGSYKSVYYQRCPDWVWYDDDDMPHLTEKATPEAIESYNYWKEKYEKSKRTGIIYD
jgi:hypothetical protein